MVANDDKDERGEASSYRPSSSSYAGGTNVLPNFPELTPSHFLVMSSLPFAAGAFVGYRRATAPSSSLGGSMDGDGTSSNGRGGGRGGGLFGRMLKPEGSTTTSPSKNGTTAAPRSARVAAAAAPASTGGIALHPAGPVLAARALVIGSLLSVSGVGLLAASIFHLSGYRSVEEAVSSLRSSVPRRRREILKGYLGIDPSDEEAAVKEDMRATKGIDGEGEWEYVKRRYMPELFHGDEEQEDGKGEGGSKNED